MVDIEDTYGILASYLQPLELVKTSLLSKIHYLWFCRYIKKNKLTDMEKFICPICACWVYDMEDDITYNDFQNIICYIDQEEKNRHELIEQVLKNKSYSRNKLICDECFNKQFEITKIKNFMKIDNFKELRKIFKYRGRRKYTIVIVNDHPVLNWAFLFQEKECEYLWNDIDFIIPSLETSQKYFTDYLFDVYDYAF
jgi:hypothetical protein